MLMTAACKLESNSLNQTFFHDLTQTTLLIIKLTINPVQAKLDETRIEYPFEKVKDRLEDSLYTRYESRRIWL